MADTGFLKKIVETLKQADIKIADAEAARGIADLCFMPHEPKFMPYLPSALPPMQSPNVMIDADFGHGKSLHSLVLMDMATHKVTHISKDAIVSINDDMTLKVRDNDFAQIPNVEINMEFHMTHKGARKLRKSKRELGLKKPRLPRKLKKKLKTDLKLMRYARGK